MGTFHDHKGALHGITVVVDLQGDRLYVGRCDTVIDEGVVLLDADLHDAGVPGKDGQCLSKEDYLSKAARVGVWARIDRVVVPAAEVVSVQPLSELA